MNNEILNQLISLIKKTAQRLTERQIKQIRLGTVLLIKDGKTSKLQLKTAGGDILDNVSFLEPYGFKSKPKTDGSLALNFTVGSDVNNIVLCIGNHYLDIAPLDDGQVCLYDESGSKVLLKNNGIIEVESKKIIANAQNAELNATQAVINAESLDLGGIGGQPLARLGDTVEVNPQTHKGFITSGSMKARAQ